MIDKIDIDLDDVDEYLNDYDDDKINDELVDYIINSVVDLDKDIVFNVNFKYKDNRDKVDVVKKRIDFTFKDLIKKNNASIKKTNYRIICMLLFGILLFWLSSLLDDFGLYTFSEIAKILCWFLISYVCEEVIFTRRKLVNIKNKYNKVINAKIVVKNIN